MAQTRCTPERGFQMQEAMRKKPRSAEALIELTGLSRDSVLRWVRTMRDAKAVRIAAWADDDRGRNAVPLYGWGSGADAERREPRTAAQRMAEVRARRRAEA